MAHLKVIENNEKIQVGTSVTDWEIYCTLDNFSKPAAIIILPKLPTF